MLNTPPAKPTRTELSPQEMRREITEHGYRGHGIAASYVRRCIEVSEHIGLSGEERYVLLSYELMKALDRVFEERMRYASVPSFLVPKPTEPKP